MTERLTLTRNAEGKPDLDAVVLNRFRQANGPKTANLRVADEVRTAAAEALSAKTKELHQRIGGDYVECAKQVARENRHLLMLSSASANPEHARAFDIDVEDDE
jgi:hypothetical protein